MRPRDRPPSISRRPSTSCQARILAGPIALMIAIPARATYALITGGVPMSNRLAVGDQSSVRAVERERIRAAEPPGDGRVQRPDDLGSHVQKRDPGHPHQELEIAGGRKSMPNARTSTGTAPRLW